MGTPPFPPGTQAGRTDGGAGGSSSLGAPAAQESGLGAGEETKGERSPLSSTSSFLPPAPHTPAPNTLRGEWTDCNHVCPAGGRAGRALLLRAVPTSEQPPSSQGPRPRRQVAVAGSRVLACAPGQPAPPWKAGSVFLRDPRRGGSACSEGSAVPPEPRPLKWPGCQAHRTFLSGCRYNVSSFFS